MRPTLALFTALVIAVAVLPAPGYAEDLQFLDGKVWSAVRIIDRGEGCLIVMHERGVRTVWGATLTEECTTRLGLARLSAPDPEKIAADNEARMETQRTEQEAAQTAGAIRQKEADAARAEKQRREQARAAAIAGRRYLVGTIIQRLDSGALVSARDVPIPRAGRLQRAGGGSPSATSNPDPNASLPRVVGLIYVHEGSGLVGKYQDADVVGVVYPAGEYSFTDTDGALQRVAAWSFSPP